MRTVSAALVAATSVALAACSTTTTVSEPIRKQQAEMRIVSQAQGKGPDDSLTTDELKAYELARLTLAKLEGAEPEKYAMQSIAMVEWSDTSLGCPKQGVSYAQVITSGHRVVLSDEQGRTRNVHTGGGRAIVCAGVTTGPIQRGPTAVSARSVDAMRTAAKEDLAGRLGIPADEIKVGLLIPTTWPDTAMGCPEPGVDYPQREQRGFRMMLSHDGRTITYHTDGQRVFPCPAIEDE